MCFVCGLMWMDADDELLCAGSLFPKSSQLEQAPSAAQHWMIQNLRLRWNKVVLR